jgi:hypothetical protein
MSVAICARSRGQRGPVAYSASLRSPDRLWYSRARASFKKRSSTAAGPIPFGYRRASRSRQSQRLAKNVATDNPQLAGANRSNLRLARFRPRFNLEDARARTVTHRHSIRVRDHFEYRWAAAVCPTAAS